MRRTGRQASRQAGKLTIIALLPIAITVRPDRLECRRAKEVSRIAGTSKTHKESRSCCRKILTVQHCGSAFLVLVLDEEKEKIRR